MELWGALNQNVGNCKSSTKGEGWMVLSLDFKDSNKMVLVPTRLLKKINTLFKETENQVHHSQ